MSMHSGEESKPGTMSDAKLREAVEAALAGKKLPLNGPELIEPGFPPTPMMPSPHGEVGPRELSATAPSNPFPGVPVIAAAPLQAPIEEPAAVAPIPAALPPSMPEAAVSHAPTMEAVEAAPPAVAPAPPAVEAPQEQASREQASYVPAPEPVVSEAPAELPVAVERPGPPAVVPGADTSTADFGGPLVLRPDSPVQLTAVPGASVPALPVQPVPVSEIAAQAARAMEDTVAHATGAHAANGAAGAGDAQRPVPMLGQLGTDNSMWEPLPGSDGACGGEAAPQLDADSGFNVTSSAWAGAVFGIVAGTLAWMQISGADEVAATESAVPAATPVIQLPAAPFEAQLTGKDLFAVDAEWVKSATFKTTFEADPRLQAASREARQ